jgi:uncharacterized protein (DUF952 family)
MDRTIEHVVDSKDASNETLSTIYHITSAREAEIAQHAGEYVPEGFAREGFIHCSYTHQLHGVLQRFFAGRTDLVLLEIDPARLNCPVVDENLQGGTELFPHIYGRLPMSAVVGIRPIGS